MEQEKKPSSFKDEDGKWHHHIRQSDISTFRQCAEMHRVKMYRLIEDRTNDTAGIGSACHDGIKEILLMNMQNKPIDLDHAIDVALWTWHEIWRDSTTAQTEIASEKAGAILIRSVLHRFMEHVYSELLAQYQILETEHPFTVPCYSDEYRVIYLQGTWDSRYEFDIQDWKTANKYYSGRDKWKYERNYLTVQDIVYPWAAEIIVFGNNPLEEEDLNRKLSHTFTYHIVPRQPTKNPRSETPTVPLADRLQLHRTVGDVKFLFDEIVSMVMLIEAELEQWPLGPTDWWCSPKWCPNWANCRGAHQGEDPWGLLKKMNASLEKKRKKNG